MATRRRRILSPLRLHSSAATNGTSKVRGPLKPALLGSRFDRESLHSPGVWITGREGFFEGRVISVNVVEETNLVFLVHCGRAVRDQNRDSRNKIHVNVFLIAIHGWLSHAPNPIPDCFEAPMRQDRPVDPRGCTRDLKRAHLLKTIAPRLPRGDTHAFSKTSITARPCGRA